jgi:molecular chaperone DnaK
MSRTIEYGIDLGTTNSCIARWLDGDLRIFQNNAQMNVTPSAVFVRKSGQAIVGVKALSALDTDPDNVAIEFKRWMGQRERKRFPASGREYSAEELSAEILRSLTADVRRQIEDEVRAAVITVPAAFGALQCEATGRAARIAGLEEAPLLQEPIAAAIGYGANPGDAAQKWLVFDLGGGTLDIAVVSTRDGRLSVLDHRGDNLLGGKDFDRAIVEAVLMPALDATYDLRRPATRSTLVARLRAKAEEAKIDLSRERQVTISLWDVGEDDTGKTIEADVELDRGQLDRLSEPLLERCCALADEALAGARVSGADIDRVLLVGGPTQSPTVRAFLEQRLGAKVDISSNPMTVVCRGAALYASTLERTVAVPHRQQTALGETAEPPPSGADVRLRLAFDPVCAGLDPLVTGRIVEGTPGLEIKIDAADGSWTSGWMVPEQQMFETQARIPEHGVGNFWLYARDGSGRALETDVTEFAIRHGLVPAPPPLPHSIWVEVVAGDGKRGLDKVFDRSTPLPSERTRQFRADHTVSPSDPSSGLRIKLWEGEFEDDPDANDWLGYAVIDSETIASGLRAGDAMELTFRIDASRHIQIEGSAGQPRTKFRKPLYQAERDEQHFTELAAHAARDATEYQDRLDRLEEAAMASGTEASVSELDAVRRDLEALKAKIGGQAREVEDPDEARRIVADAKSVRGRLSRLELRPSDRDTGQTPVRFAELIEATEAVVRDFGSPVEQQQLNVLKRQLERAVERSDTRATTRIAEEIGGFRWRVLGKQDWFWREIFESQCQPGVPFEDPGEAARLIDSGREVIASGDGQRLREVVRSLWDLQPRSSEEASRERALASGLRRY